MNLNEAFVKSVRSYFEGTTLKEMETATQMKLKYTKAYFDTIAKEFGLDIDEDVEKEIDTSGKGKK